MMKESISKLLVDNLDMVFFFYGFAFVDLGISIFIQLRVTKKSFSSDVLLSNADIAMYQAKINGKNQYRFYDKIMQQKAA